MLRPGALPDCLKHLGQPEDSYRSQFLRTIDNGVGIFLFLLIFKYSCRSKNCVCGHFYLLAPAFVLLFLECFLKHWHLSAFHRILHKHLKNPSQREQHHFFFLTTVGNLLTSLCSPLCGFPWFSSGIIPI